MDQNRQSRRGHFLRGDGKTELGAPAQAVQLRQSLLDNNRQAPRDQANNRALLSATLAEVGDLDQAMEHSLLILPHLGTSLISGRVLQRLRPVRDAAGAARATEFCNRFDAAARALSTT